MMNVSLMLILLNESLSLILEEKMLLLKSLDKKISYSN